MLIPKSVIKILPLSFGDNQIVDIQLFHHIVIFILVNWLISRSVYLESLHQLTEFILENQVDTLIEMLPRFS